MPIKKRNKHDYSARLYYMQLLEEGYSISYLHKCCGINETDLQILWSKYQSKGPSGLLKITQSHPTFDIRRKVVSDIEQNCLTLSAASLKYGYSRSAIGRWLKVSKESGIEALLGIKSTGRSSTMARKKTAKQPLTELEQLRQENEELRLENALLKKVRALVEEKKARLRVIGRESSKN
jgi:transposase-like protein